MKPIKYLFTLILFGSLIYIPSSALAQSQEEESSSSGFNLQFNSSLGGVYFQDGLSSEIVGKPIAVDGSVDLSNYRLGPNDLITVTIKANQPIILRGLLVNPQGDVVLPSIGNINIENQTISQAEQTIQKTASEVFKNPSVTITLEYPKPIVVHVSGNIPYPGKQNISAFSRTDLAIFGAFNKTQKDDEGNVIPPNTSTLLNNNNISLRNITIMHQDGSVQKADLVAYFRAGELSKNPIVRNGDRINITKLTNETPRISISGAVKNESELEFSSADTPSFLIEIAGGTAPEADTSKLYIYRNVNGSTNRLEVPNENWNSFELLPNDRLVVPKDTTANNAASAWVSGEVNIPGNFPIDNGKTNALELLELAGSLTEQALPSAAYLIRSGSLENEIPNKFNTELLKRTSDQVEQGFQYLDLETRVSQNKVFIDLQDKEQLGSVKIYDGDRLYVPRDEETIFVFGQINNPGYYPFTSNDQTVYDYIDRAGGFALSANQDRIFIIKAGSGTWFHPSETQLESGDRIFVDRHPYDELNAQRSYEIQKQQVKNTRIQLIMTGITTITGIITTYVAVTRN